MLNETFMTRQTIIVVEHHRDIEKSMRKFISSRFSIVVLISRAPIATYIDISLSTDSLC
jgi:hypothetical protein